MDAVHEDELQEKIGGADAAKERIELAIIDLDDALYICRAATAARLGVAELRARDHTQAATSSRNRRATPEHERLTRPWTRMLNCLLATIATAEHLVTHRNTLLHRGEVRLSQVSVGTGHRLMLQRTVPQQGHLMSRFQSSR